MENPFIYSSNNKRYHSLDYYYKTKFREKVFKVSLDAGFTCPNIDGKVGTEGCIYCSKQKKDIKPLLEQFEQVKNIMKNKWESNKYIGYFQAHTNTYGNVAKLKENYESILALENVIGLSIATRPDSIDNDCLEYLRKLNKLTFLTIELGLQTIHESTSKLINRCHTLKCFEDMVRRLRVCNINVVVHVINGLPYESKEMMIDTIKYLNNLDIQGIKIHMLHILKNTSLEDLYNKTKFYLLSKDEYIQVVCNQLEYLRPEIVIHRITGDPEANELIEPSWITRKIDVMNGIDKELARRNSYQGAKLEKNKSI